MKLIHEEEILKLNNCPSSNTEKTIKLYRWSKGDNDLIKPFAIINPVQNDKKCLCWGLSHYNSLQYIENKINAMSLKRKSSIKGVYCIEVTKELAIKHQSTSDRNHYTVYPYEGIDFISNFVKVSN